MIDPRYFQALAIPLRRGRPFTDADTAHAPPVCIVNEAFVRRYARGRDPIGLHVRVSAMDPRGPTQVEREIVGVSGQIKIDGLEEATDPPEIYVPLAQNSWFWGNFVIQTDGDPLALSASARAAIATIDKDQAITRIRPMDDLLRQATAQPRFRAQLVGLFAAIALLLAAVGIFGVLAFAVSQRTREFGIRMALGARASDVLRLVLRSGLRLMLTGIAIGLAASVTLTRFLASMLFGVEPLDPLTLTAAVILLSVVALAACLAPALRAARVHPVVALRHE
jgi:putative ABC transport system permease protein